MSKKLKPCPFCGTSDLLGFEFTRDHGWTIVVCRKCGGSGPTGRSESEQEAASWWNGRHDDKRVAELEAKLEEMTSKAENFEQMLCSLETLTGIYRRRDIQLVKPMPPALQEILKNLEQSPPDREFKIPDLRGKSLRPISFNQRTKYVKEDPEA